MQQYIVQARWIRAFRWLHRKLALASFLFFLLVTVTGVLLGWKKEMGFQAPTAKGASANPLSWLPIGVLHEKANLYLRDSVDSSLSTELDRIDVRPAKGIAKFIYLDHYWGLQLDCTTGELLSIEKRSSDFIEDLHDGSIVDRLIGAPDEPVKLGYILVLGLSLTMLVLSGLWMWWGPRRIRFLKKQHK